MGNSTGKATMDDESDVDVDVDFHTLACIPFSAR